MLHPQEAVAPALDAATLATCRDLAGRTFPWDTNRALELALLKTFCVPSIASLLQRTGEFERRPRKRYDDTGLMVAELLRLGPDSPGGRAVIQRLNRIHSTYSISDADYAYVLSGFVAEPIRWIERFGWRPLDAKEQEALFRFWNHVGGLMGLEKRPQNLQALLELNDAVERQRFRCTASNFRIADATLQMLLEPWPAPLRPLFTSAVRSLLEPEVLASLNWPQAPALLSGIVQTTLRIRSRLLNLLRSHFPRRQYRFYSERPTPSYGTQFQMEQLGPPPMLERLNSPRWEGSQRRIGLTGGIASGKSSVGRLLAARGYPVLDADQYAREALAPGSPGAKTVAERYGSTVVLAEKQPMPSLDRAALGRIVFGSAAERCWLEQIVHPMVRKRFEQDLEQLACEPVVVLMIPLLFEAGLESLCSEVWLVDCEPEQQLERLMARDGLNHEEAKDRIKAQWPLERKRLLTDRVINNRGEVGMLIDQLD